MPCDQCVTINDRQFKIDNEPYYPMVMLYNFLIVHDLNPSSASNYYLSRSRYYGPCNAIDCDFDPAVFNDKSVLTSEIANDFNVIKNQLGFNAIRTAGVGPQFFYERDQIKFPCPRPNEFVQHAELLSNSSYEGECMVLNPQDPNDPMMNRLFEFYRVILEQAYNQSIKVLLDVGQQDVMTSNARVALYKTYLGHLASYIRSLPIELQETLIGYMIVEEPEYEQKHKDDPMISYDKSWVCSFTRDVYEVLKNADPYHLIGVGGTTVRGTLLWDPGVMNIDFWCPHPYPYPVHDEYNYIDPNSDFAVYRVLDELVWLGKNCPIPWLIGETGFSAIDDNVQDPVGHAPYPLVNGELAVPSNGERFTQLTFAEAVRDHSRNCEASGFSFWQYQELDWKRYPANEHLYENGYGIMRHNGTAKAAAAAFSSYLDVLGRPPAIDARGCEASLAYYNPYQFGSTNLLPGYNIIGWNNSESGAVSGFVVDATTNQPIKDVFIQAYSWLSGNGVPNSPTNKYQELYTFSDPSGFFKLVPYNYIYPNQQPVISKINISYPGYSVYRAGIGGSIPLNVNLGTIAIIKKMIEYDLIYTKNVSNGNIDNLVARNNIHITSIQDASYLTARANNAIVIYPGSEMKLGTYVDLSVESTFPQCSDFTGLGRFQNMMSTNNEVDLLNGYGKSLNLQFNEEIKEKWVEIFPNPNSGLVRYRLNLSSDDKLLSDIVIYNSFGIVTQIIKMHEDVKKNEIGSFQLEGPPGVYTACIDTKSGCEIIKIIKL